MPEPVRLPSGENVDQIRADLRSRLPDVIANLRAKANEHSTDAPRREAGYTITNAAAADGDTAVLRIYDEIWWLGVNAEDVARDLDAVTAPKIRVEINSPGGDVWDGIAIYNALRSHAAEVTTRVDGMAASIASVIAQAGDHRVMAGGSQMMIHNASMVTIGDKAYHAKSVEILAVQDEIIAGIYASRSGKPVEGFAELMEAETWMTADRAVSEGLADEVAEPNQPPPQDRTPTLRDELSAAMDVVAGAITSTERVAALRADAGKGLSNAVTADLAGLRDCMARLDDLLTTETTSDTGTDRIAAEFARYVALTQGASS